jgi:hypothetical protein
VRVLLQSITADSMESLVGYELQVKFLEVDEVRNAPGPC